MVVNMLQLTGVGKRFGARQVIAGLEPADAGSILFDEAELTQLSDDTLTLLRRDRFGFVFQAFHVLAHLTLVQNVSLPLLLRSNFAKALSAAGRNSTRQAMPALDLGPRNGPPALAASQLDRARTREFFEVCLDR
jgi:putative ABC transport system ATP-binding protein